MDTQKPDNENPLAEQEFTLAVCVLASGSRGNAIYITDGATAILIDAGPSGIEIQRRLNSRGLQSESLKAILVTHEHADHIQGVGALSRRLKLPVYLSRKTKKASFIFQNIQTTHYFECGQPFEINELTIHPFSISHDAEDPAGFTIQKNNLKIGIATDLGTVSSMVKHHLRGCSLLILEANHDPAMLMNGPYPWPLKQRIQSRIGHLSNKESKSLLNEVIDDRLQYIILAHLSETNNTPQKAVSAVAKALRNCPAQLTVATQDRCGEIFFLKNDGPGPKTT
jgi:phosphoribosyl 1,2-cyclic phosphodiesterase